MKLFNRKNDEIDELRNELNDWVSEFGGKISGMKRDFDEFLKSYAKDVDELLELKKELAENKKQFSLLQAENKKLQEDYTEVLNKCKEVLKIDEELNRNISELMDDKKDEKECKTHLYDINGASYCRKYSDLKLKGKDLISTKGKLSFNITDVIGIKENLQEYHRRGLSVRAVGTENNVSSDVIYRIIWNIEEGCFDELIEEYEKLQKLKGVENYHIYKLKKSYHQPLKRLRVEEGGVLYNKNNQRLPYNIQDVIELRDMVYSGRYANVKDLYNYFSDRMSRQLCLKLIWNIEEGNFDELIDEYSSRNYSYENRYNILYVNGEDTGLTIEKCNVIVDCIINDPNKQECVNKLIKNYPSTKPKYIRIIADEYNNVNLSKVLKKEVKKVGKVDNPQKRKEMGLYL